MELKDIYFDLLETVTKRCVTFARDGNTVVKPYKKLFKQYLLTLEEKVINGEEN